MELRKERSRWEIIHDLLHIAFDEKKAKKTRIMQRACLDWRNFKRYYDYLMEEGLLANCNPENEFYMITDKGKEVLNKLKEMDEILKMKLPTASCAVSPVYPAVVVLPDGCTKSQQAAWYSDK